MPTAIPSGEKTAFIAVVTAYGDFYEAGRLATVLNYFEDLPFVLSRQQVIFAQNNAYLVACMSVFETDSNLTGVGIYFNHTDLSTLTNPLYIINTSYSTGLEVTISSNQGGLTIWGSSSIDVITINTSISLDYLYIGDAVIVNKVNASATSAYIGTLEITNYRYPSTLNQVQSSSNIGAVIIATGAIYGGYLTDSPIGTCAELVTSFAIDIGTVTHNSVHLTWVPPTNGYVNLLLYFRVLNTLQWILVDQTIGNYEGNSGFFFTNLESDTFYEFKIITVCINGVYSAAQLPTPSNIQTSKQGY